jgi:putative transcriptional regulator
MPEKTVKWTVSEILDKREMSTQEFADRAGISYQTALNLRRGSTTRVDIQTLQNICTALGVQPGDLLIYSS